MKMKKQINPKLLLLLCSFILKTYAQTNQIENQLSQLLISNDFELRIIKKHPVIDDITAVEVNLPYREFPSILFFKMNNGKWEITFEGLSPGIEDDRSGYLDWHTKSLAVDMKINFKDKGFNEFNDPRIRKIVERSIKGRRAVFIVYKDFIHMHITDSTSNKHFKAYTIDKTEYIDLARKIIPTWSDNYSIDNCIMFDSPKILNSEFKKEDKQYLIIVKTDNNQTWRYSFDGIDNENRYLLNKKISVQKTKKHERNY